MTNPSSLLLVFPATSGVILKISKSPKKGRNVFKDAINFFFQKAFYFFIMKTYGKLLNSDSIIDIRVVCYDRPQLSPSMIHDTEHY